MAYMPEKRIENSSIELLQAFLAKTKFEFKPPVAVEDILEFMYQVTPQVADLQALYGNEAVLGRSQYIDGQIVDEILGVRLLTIHNLHYFLDLIHRIRERIASDTLDEMASEFDD